MEIATLAAAFPGRLDVGLGHGLPGWIRQVGAWPKSPLTLLREQTAALRALLAGERVTVEGRYVRLTDVQLEAPPAVVPRILAGVRGPRSMALAGEVADGTVLAEPITPEYLEVTFDQLGRPEEHRIVTYNVAAVDDDAETARGIARPGLEWIGEPDWAVHINPLPFAEEFRQLRASSADRDEFTRRMPAEGVGQLGVVGTPEARRRRPSWRDGHEFTGRMPAAWVDQLAIPGTPEAARRRLEDMAGAGVATAVLIPAGDPLAALESFARLL